MTINYRNRTSVGQINGIAIAVVTGCLAIHSFTAYAADSSLGMPLCEILKKLVPEVKTFKPEGARAQLVMAMAEKFDYDAAKLKQVKAEIDKVTTASCPKDREAMLGIVKMKSLADAVS